MTESAKTSRRALMKAGAMLATGGLAVTGAARAQDQKLEQSVVQYQDTPKDGAECDKCVNWVDPNACKIVAGKISPKGWCVAFAPKEG